MFEIGKSYEITMCENGLLNNMSAGEVLEVSLPLVKFKSPFKDNVEIIINTASSVFVKAHKST